MDRSEIEKLLHASLEPDADPVKVRGEMESFFADYDFKSDFKDRLFQALFPIEQKLIRYEFFKSIGWAFSRVAIISAAAIILLLISIFVNEGSFSLNAIFGFSDNYDETIISMLTGY